MLRVQWSLQWDELWPQQPALCSLHKIFISGEGSHLSILMQRYSSMHAQFGGWHQSIHFPTQVDLYFFPLCDLLSNGYHEAHRRGFMIFEANILGKHAVWVVYSWMNKKSGIPSIAGWKENNCMHSSWWEWNSFLGEKLDIQRREIWRWVEYLGKPSGFHYFFPPSFSVLFAIFFTFGYVLIGIQSILNMSRDFSSVAAISYFQRERHE